MDIKNIIFNLKFIAFSFLLLQFQTSCSQNNAELQAEKISSVVSKIDAFYVEDVKYDKIVETAIISMLKELDPHSVYLNKEQVKRSNEQLKGSFVGIGIYFNINNDTLLITSPIPDGPCEKVGIRAGDRIIKVNQENIAGIELTNKLITSKLRGDKGSIVNLSIQRKNIKELLEFKVKRDKIPIFSLDASYMIDDEIAYIKINRFAGKTMKEYKKALKKLKKQGLKHLIIDLQGNGGGYLKTAVELADEFLSKKKMIVYTEGKNYKRKEYKSTSKGEFDKKKHKVVVLIDEGSASASEIFSGAIQDWDRGVVIGRRSFAKGLVQRPFYLNDGSLVRLTIARYYTPTGRLIQKTYKNGVKEYRNEIKNRIEHGELNNSDSIHFDDSLKFKTLKKKRIVYGGGGIMPDIFVPIDTIDISDYYKKIQRKGIIYDFVLKYVDENRNKLEEKYSDFEFFKNDFKITDKILDNFLVFAEKEGVEKDKEGLDISKNVFQIQIKSLIAKDIFGRDEFFYLINDLDKAYLKAVEILQNDKLYKKELSRNGVF